MYKRKHFVVAFIFLIGITLFYCTANNGDYDVAGSSNYADLVSLFNEFCEFQQPEVVDGVPDFSAAVMGIQCRELKIYQNRLVAIDQNNWPVSE